MTGIILADIGGTHARFAFFSGKGLQMPEKLEANLHESLPAALAAYGAGHGIRSGKLIVATAAQPDEEGVWRFHNNNDWLIDRQALAKEGWQVVLLLNDFAASARGAVVLEKEELTTLKAGHPDPALPRAILGPGTGLGLAYMIPVKKSWHVQQTFGGHMLAAAHTDEQAEIIKLIGKGRAAIVVPEDIASGRGLPNLYKAVCALNAERPVHKTTEELFDHAAQPAVVQTLRLFHEFLGLFAHNALVAGNAFGGLYLDGGVVRKLQENKLFDFASFEQSVVLNAVPSVRRALDETPMHIVNDPFVALRGLAEMVRDAA